MNCYRVLYSSRLHSTQMKVEKRVAHVLRGPSHPAEHSHTYECTRTGATLLAMNEDDMAVELVLPRSKVRALQIESVRDRRVHM